MRKPKHVCRLCLFLIGGLAYNLIELLWRGRTHWSMFFVGGWCFRLIGKIYRRCSHMHLGIRCSLSALVVTIVEFFSGCVVNLHWKLDVWSYKGMPLNIYGQVCLLYSILWGLLSIPAGILHTRCEAILYRLAEKHK